MPEAFTRSLRVRPEDWDAFRRLQLTLERQFQPNGRLSQADVFRICVGSLSTAVATGLPVPGLPLPPAPRDG